MDRWIGKCYYDGHRLYERTVIWFTTSYGQIDSKIDTEKTSSQYNIHLSSTKYSWSNVSLSEAEIRGKHYSSFLFEQDPIGPPNIWIDVSRDKMRKKSRKCYSEFDEKWLNTFLVTRVLVSMCSAFCRLGSFRVSFISFVLFVIFASLKIRWNTHRK